MRTSARGCCTNCAARRGRCDGSGGGNGEVGHRGVGRRKSRNWPQTKPRRDQTEVGPPRRVNCARVDAVLVEVETWDWSPGRCSRGASVALGSTSGATLWRRSERGGGGAPLPCEIEILRRRLRRRGRAARCGTVGLGLGRPAEAGTRLLGWEVGYGLGLARGHPPPLPREIEILRFPRFYLGIRRGSVGMNETGTGRGKRRLCHRSTQTGPDGGGPASAGKLRGWSAAGGTRRTCEKVGLGLGFGYWTTFMRRWYWV